MVLEGAHDGWEALADSARLSCVQFVHGDEEDELDEGSDWPAYRSWMDTLTDASASSSEGRPAPLDAARKDLRAFMGAAARAPGPTPPPARLVVHKPSLATRLHALSRQIRAADGAAGGVAPPAGLPFLMRHSSLAPSLSNLLPARPAKPSPALASRALDERQHAAGGTSRGGADRKAGEAGKAARGPAASGEKRKRQGPSDAAGCAAPAGGPPSRRTRNAAAAAGPEGPLAPLKIVGGVWKRG